jgi:uncharacterized protein
VKLHLDARTALNTFTGYGPDYVSVNGTRHTRSLIVLPEALVYPWEVGAIDSLSVTDFDPALPYHPEILLLGTGPTFRWAHPRIAAALMTTGIGFECMDTHAACRTYNVLLGEGRKVVAAILLASS